VPDAPDPAILHRPVLLAEVVEHLAPAPGKRMLDCTLGLGGHSEALLAAGAMVAGVDRDGRARELASRRLSAFGGGFTVRAGTFADAAEAAVRAGERFDGVLADLGVSSMQLDDEQRGFSMRSEALADMRMGDGCADSAVGLIDRLDEQQLADVIFRYGEERLSRRIARALKRGRAEGRLATGAELAAEVRRVVPGHTHRHPAARTFQALRIAVNDELGQLERLLAVLPGLLAEGGRAVVISFHSLEDRLVKNSFREHRAAGRFAAIAKRVVVAGDAELAANPRSAPAKLRWAAR
jgi:16S rRNA (cytosine1402-N4)-methyltransferase